MANGAESRIKGVAFRELLRWEADQHGVGRLASLVVGLPQEMRRHFDAEREYLGVLPSSWYPAPVVHALLDGLTAGMSPAERDRWAHAGAKEVMNATLGGIYKRLMSLLVSPQLYARFSAKVWQSYYDSGDFAVDITDATTADCTVSNWEAHHPVICAMNTEAATAIYEAIGMRDVRTERTECVGNGDALCRFITTWAG